MNDFGKLLREMLVEEEPYRPDEGTAAIGRAVAAFETRMRTVRILGSTIVLAPTLFLAAGAWLWIDAGPEDGTGRLLGAMLVLFGLTASGIGKLWLNVMVDHVQVMKELKLARLELAELAERLEERGGSSRG